MREGVRAGCDVCLDLCLCIAAARYWAGCLVQGWDEGGIEGRRRGTYHIMRFACSFGWSVEASWHLMCCQ